MNGTMERTGIIELLNRAIPNRRAAYEWLTSPNSKLDSEAPICVMVTSEGFRRVVELLQSIERREAELDHLRTCPSCRRRRLLTQKD